MTSKLMKSIAFVALLGAASAALAAGLLDVSYRPLTGKTPVNLKERYAGQVLRVRGTQLAPARQLAQVGVELIGGAAPAADAEVAVVAVEALAAVGVTVNKQDRGGQGRGSARAQRK